VTLEVCSISSEAVAAVCAGGRCLAGEADLGAVDLGVVSTDGDSRVHQIVSELPATLCDVVAEFGQALDGDADEGLRRRYSWRIAVASSLSRSSRSE